LRPVPERRVPRRAQRTPPRAARFSKIDPDTNRVVATIKLGFRPDGVVVADGLVWVAVCPDDDRGANERGHRPLGRVDDREDTGIASRQAKR
jgi:hypothetical protein